jgi:cytochrome P450
MKPLADYSLADTATASSPWEYYAHMRSEEPVHFDKRLGGWIVTRFEDCQQAARMAEELSNQLGFAEALRTPWQDEVDALMTREGFGPHVISDNFQVDPPLHARRRGLVNQAFGAHRIAAMERHITDIVRALTAKFITRGTADLVSEYAVPIAITVISDILAVPRERIHDVERWSDATVAPLSGMINREQQIAYAYDTMDMHRFLKEQIEDRRTNRRDDVISDLVHATIEDPEAPRLSFAELLSISVAFLAAGNETTRNSISGGARILAQRPDILSALREADDQERALRNFVEEVLRYESVVPQVPRVATRDCHVGGVAIPKGAIVWLSYAAANFDASKFPHPDEPQVDRKNAGQHLAFGSGIHRCIGAMLARMEMKCAFREIVEQMDGLTLSKAIADLRSWNTIVFRGLRELPVTFVRR